VLPMQTGEFNNPASALLSFIDASTQLAIL
jgi:hypothetical protein